MFLTSIWIIFKNKIGIEISLFVYLLCKVLLFLTFYPKPSLNIAGCPPWRYGQDCLPCRCNINNTMSCDTNSGKCTCKAGYSGDLCDCVAGKHTCNSTTSYCHVDSGNPVCLCKKGVISSVQNPCVGKQIKRSWWSSNKFKNIPGSKTNQEPWFVWKKLFTVKHRCTDELWRPPLVYFNIFCQLKGRAIDI